MKSANSITLGSRNRRCGVSAAKVTGRGRRLARHFHQRAAGQMVGDLEDGFQDNPAPIQRPTGQHVPVIGFEWPRYLEAARPVGRLQRPLKLCRAGKAQGQAIMPVRDQRRAVAGQATAGDVIGRGA